MAWLTELRTAGAPDDAEAGGMPHRPFRIKRGVTYVARRAAVAEIRRGRRSDAPRPRGEQDQAEYGQ
jgi:hypothetical protein